jgi:hypothetical protein
VQFCSLHCSHFTPVNTKHNLSSGTRSAALNIVLKCCLLCAGARHQQPSWIRRLPT